MDIRQPQPPPDTHPEANAVIIPNTVSARCAVATQNFIGASYVYLFIGLVWSGLAAFAVMIFFFPRWTLGDPLVTTLILLGTTIAARIVFFSFLEATWWMAGYERYLVPVMPLTSCFFVLLGYEAVIVCRRGNDQASTTAQGRL